MFVFKIGQKRSVMALVWRTVAYGASRTWQCSIFESTWIIWIIFMLIHTLVCFKIAKWNITLGREDPWSLVTVARPVSRIVFLPLSSEWYTALSSWAPLLSYIPPDMNELGELAARISWARQNQRLICHEFITCGKDK